MWYSSKLKKLTPKRFIILATTVLVAILVPATIVIASSWEYYTKASITDTSGSNRTGVPVLIDDIKGQNLIDAGYINATATNTYMTEGVAERHYLITNERIATFIPSLSANQQRTYSLYTGYSPVATSFDIIVGTDGYITTPDDASIELGDNFEVELEGYINTSANRGIIHKPGAFAIRVTDTEEITGGIIDYEVWTDGTEDSYSTGAITDQIVLQLEDNKFVVIFEIANLYARVGTVSGETITWGIVSAALGHDPNGWDACVIDTDTFVVSLRSTTDGDDGYTAVGTISGTTVTWADTDEFINANIADVACCKVDTDKWATSYEETAGTDTETVICTWSGTETTVGTPVVIDTSGADEYGCCQLDTDKYVTVWEAGGDIETIVCTVIGTVPTAGALKEISLDNPNHTIGALQLGTDTFMAYWSETTLEAEICTVSTTTITDSTQYTITATNPSDDSRCIKVRDGELLFFISDSSADRQGESYSATYSGTVISPVDLANVFFTEAAEDVQDVSGCLLEEGTDKVMAVFSDASADDGFAEIGYLGSIAWDKSAIATSITTGDMKVKVDADGTNLKIYIDDVEKDSTALSGSSVSDNAFDWTVMSNVSPYLDYLTIDVSSVEKLKYEPNAMISGNALPDRTGSNDGTITWGTNSSLTTSVGSTYTYESTSPAAGSGERADTITPATMPADWYGEAGGVTDLPFYTQFHSAATDMGMTTQTLYLMVMLGIASAVGLGVMIFTGSAMLATVGAGLVMAIGVSTSILGWWMLFIFAVLAGGGLYLSRTM